MRPDRVDWERLAAALTGPLERPGSPGYAAVRRRYVGGESDRLPRAVAYCVDEDDVAAAVMFARSRGLRFAVRSGGHSYADHSSTDGLLLDLRRLRGARRRGERVCVGAGTTLGELSGRLAPDGRVVPSGACPTVAVGGIALAGGFGFLGRRYGLTADHVLAARVVLADGRIAVTDHERDPDLFWALRGAGCGNFAVVTELVLRTRPLPALTSFRLVWDFPRAAEVVDAWQRWAPGAPGDVTAEAAVTAPDDANGPPAVEVYGTTGRPRDETARLLTDLTGALSPPGRPADIRELAPADAAGYLSGGLTRTYDEAWIPAGPFPRPGFQYLRSEFFTRSLPPAALEDAMGRLVADRAPGEHRSLELAPWRGAYADTEPGATAFVHRRAEYSVTHTAVLGARAAPGRRRAARRWVGEALAALHPYGMGRVYQGHPDPDLTDWARAYYGDNLPRLADVKSTYDPDGTFAFAQSIPRPFLRVPDPEERQG